MSADPARAALDDTLLAWMREPGWKRDDARFEDLAHRLFTFQFEHCAAYRHFCQRRGRTPDALRSWLEIPPVPTGAWKEVTLTCFPAERAVHAFRTSGTSTRTRGVLHLDTLALYEASLLPTLRRHLLPDLPAGSRARFEILAPPPGEAPDSSLSYMFATAIREFGTEESTWGVRSGALDTEAVLTRLRRDGERDEPLALCGTAFAFVHLLDELAARGEHLDLAGGARIMETGGFKGRSRELSPTALYAAIEAGLGVPQERIVNQYGMTELASQFYDSVLVSPGAPRRKLGPPWSRVAIVDPETGESVAPGQTGAIVILDLANTGSLCAVQTADLGRVVGDGFEVVGREPGAEARGCSIAADLLLAAS